MNNDNVVSLHKPVEDALTELLKTSAQKLLAQAETYIDNGQEKYEFTEMFNDFISLV